MINKQLAMYNMPINGTSLDVTLTILLIPPSIDTATKIATRTPKTQPCKSKKLPFPPVMTITCSNDWLT